MMVKTKDDDAKSMGNQVCVNVTDQEEQYLDEEALNLALEEEARAKHEWLEKCRLSHPAKAVTRGVTSWVSSQHNGVNNREDYNALSKTKIDTKCNDNT
uniref:Uncharacterized protein n=1 Tax=Tanacetum cinerariifolium TaxID=118510 RepID=A0A699I2E1_TANCI|nr:hypothetical protein [Tanacetum cinerariifolium]